MNIQPAVKEYLEWKTFNCPTAGKSYRSFLKRFVSHFKEKELESLHLHQISEFVSKLKEVYQPRSIYYMISILKDFFKYYPNIVTPHHLRNPRMIVSEVRHITEEEFKDIDLALGEGDSFEVRTKLIHHILWSTGLRVSELCSIKLDDINLKDRSAKVTTAKSKREGYIMWSVRANELLINYLGYRLMRGGDYLFDISTRQIERIIKQISENLGFEGITPHKYRHGKAHQVLKDGGTIDDIAFILRHANPMMTKKMYLRLDRNENLAIMGKYV